MIGVWSTDRRGAALDECRIGALLTAFWTRFALVVVSKGGELREVGLR
jgi:hypothetical protein